MQPFLQRQEAEDLFLVRSSSRYAVAIPGFSLCLLQSARHLPPTGAARLSPLVLASPDPRDAANQSTPGRAIRAPVRAGETARQHTP